MKIADKSVVEMHYTLTNGQGEILDSSEGRDPLTYIQGTSSIVPGLEKALDGKTTGESLQVTVPPEEGYGVRDESLTQTVALSNFGDQADQVKPGISFQMPTDQGVAIATVTSIENGD
ncbi:MAG: FKBP-type peptidyl-prolyl cis-trans isomerase, partial [Lentisphaeraceae bacterium]|nr:FKBP-type peptidyl-prolyl cis-trans isomerase [Lentisphaeraceae bacterium]